MRIRRKGLAARSLATSAIALALALATHGRTATAADEKTPDALPLKNVVLFTSSVGFFEHLAEVNGNQKVMLRFETDQIDDLLKSLVVEDKGGGQIAAINYEREKPPAPAQAPVIELAANPSLAELLIQLRGQKVAFDNGGAVVEGTIVGVERRPVPIKPELVAELDFVNVKTATGVRSLPLAGIQETRFADPAVDKKFQTALEALNAPPPSTKKNVTLDFRGNGKRGVRIGYIRETPVWKMSYRVVLKDGQAPHLQGWAIVENTSAADWKDVRVSLVSGRPISFVMNLYQPLYQSRPTVVPEQYAGLMPKTHDQDLSIKPAPGNPPGGNATIAVGSAPKPGGFGGGGFSGGGAGGGLVLGGRGFGGGGDPDATRRSRPVTGEDPFAEAQRIDPRASVSADAKASDVGELFEYEIKTPVTLARHESALLPIINDAIAGEKFSLFNPSTHAKHPLGGFKLKNISKLHLMQGPITIFDDGVYAGEARITDIAPGSERIVTYMLDLGLEVSSVVANSPDELQAVRIRGGAIHFQEKSGRVQTYTVKNSSPKAKRLLIEKPIDNSWQLVAPAKPEEKTRDLYRFSVATTAGQATEFVVREEQTNVSSVVLVEINSDPFDDPFSSKEVNSSIGVKYGRYTSAQLLQSAVVSPAVKTALKEIASRQQELLENAKQIKIVETAFAAITTEQSRIRQNMERLDRTGELYKRYLKTLNEQEDELIKLKQQAEKLQSERATKTAAFQKYLAELDVK